MLVRLSVQQVYYSRNREKVLAKAKAIRDADPVYNRVRKLKQNYGMTLEEWNTLFASQNQCCALCGTSDFSVGKGACVDHDHVTKKVRAILCQPCNMGLGAFRDRPDVLRAAADYIEQHKRDAE